MLWLARYPDAATGRAYETELVTGFRARHTMLLIARDCFVACGQGGSSPLIFCGVSGKAQGENATVGHNILITVIRR